jgi:uncharacterized repeat protein (TIGR01451 family)
MRTKSWTRLFLLIPLMAALLGAAPSAAPSWQARVDRLVLQDLAASGQAEFLIYMSEQADLSAALKLEGKTAKGRYVYEQLSRTARRTQGPVIALLQQAGAEYRPYWAANLVWARGGAALVQSLAQRPDVSRLYANPQIKNDLPPADRQPALASLKAIEPNLTLVGAPLAWAAGIRGQGVVVAGQDTGYDWTHPGLISQYRGWDGTTADHNYNWHDAIHSVTGNVCGANSAEPCDDYGHGTHTMGIMLGDDGQGNQVGMAPAARWIGCRNMNNGYGTPATYTECYQFFIAPTDLNDQNANPDLAPDVIDNSWGCPPSEGCTDPLVLQTVVENVRLAGILSVNSAGNDGPYCSTVQDPASTYDAVFTVGNTQVDDSINMSSSRGPVSVDGSGRLKPDISAPGTSIRSTFPGGGYVFMTGTSMAAPHVAGEAALLLSANPLLRGNPDALEAVITQTAKTLTTAETCGGTAGLVPNNTFGWGRIQAWEAVKQVHPLWVEGQASTSGAAGRVQPGGLITYTFSLSYTGATSPALGAVITGLLPAQTVLVSATQPYTQAGTLFQWLLGDLQPGEGRSVDLVVSAALTATGVITNQDYAARALDLQPVLGQPLAVQVILPANRSVYLPLAPFSNPVGRR